MWQIPAISFNNEPGKGIQTRTGNSNCHINNLEFVGQHSIRRSHFLEFYEDRIQAAAAISILFREKFQLSLNLIRLLHFFHSGIQKAKKNFTPEQI